MTVSPLLLRPLPSPTNVILCSGPVGQYAEQPAKDSRDLLVSLSPPTRNLTD